MGYSGADPLVRLSRGWNSCFITEGRDNLEHGGLLHLDTRSTLGRCMRLDWSPRLGTAASASLHHSLALRDVRPTGGSDHARVSVAPSHQL